MKEITSKYELEEMKNWYKQLRILGGHIENDVRINSYTNYINIYNYVYDLHTNELIKIVVEEVENDK